MPNPDPAAAPPVLGESPQMQTPFKWFAEAYPFIDGTAANARRAHEDEFIVLQTKINQGAKNRVCLRIDGIFFGDAKSDTDVFSCENLQRQRYGPDDQAD